ncbi:MAG: alpha-galactosidase [Thermoleophilaceae bacterium]|jgi:hypothetical protein|nr:alpha-galactosidase [Thermoleophilaceae bacterium]
MRTTSIRRRGRFLWSCSTAASALLALATPAHAAPIRDGDVYADVTADRVTLGNAVAERVWSRAALVTLELRDKRGGGLLWSRNQPDFRLSVGGPSLTSEQFAVSDARVEPLPRGGLRVTMELAGPAGLNGTRIAEAYPGVAGFRTQTVLVATSPLTLAGATLDEAAVGAEPAVTLHNLRAGADWRSPDYEGPPMSVGDPQAGTWRATTTGKPGQPVAANAEWLSATDGGRTLAMVMERNDQPSSRADYDGQAAQLEVDYERDVISLGPLEENAHLENPNDDGGRERQLEPGVPFPLEPAFVALGAHDGDAEWQHYAYLIRHRLRPYPEAVTFNSNGTDDNKRSTGAKDDLDMEVIREVAPIAKRLGVETFILDDGWQARSGDWQPDSPEYPEPRWDGEPGSKFSPRFPDSEFKAVREAIAPMRLGLWWTPLHFHPSSETYKQHPEWMCRPVGDALLAYNTGDPESSSNEAGLVTWGQDALPHIEERLRDAIENWGVRYFKWDFIAWLDCAGQGDIYTLREALLGMLDRLQADHPDVTFQIDETNDYRLFPYESVARGPSWFQNGSPEYHQLLHNLWNLAPYVPTFSLGQHFLGGRSYEKHPIATLMAAALFSHITVFSDLREIPAKVIDQARPWIAFYKRHRPLLTHLVYPLLADPYEKKWTALQSWNPERATGALVAFRQQDDREAVRIKLRNVPPGRRFVLRRGLKAKRFATVTSARLARGLRVRLPRKDTAQVLLIRSVRKR